MRLDFMNRLNDMRLTRKLLLLYLLCVFLPILITNSVFLYNAADYARREKLEEAGSALRRVNLKIKRLLTDAVLVTHLVNADDVLIRHLDERYDSPRQYTDAYLNYLNDALLRYSQIYSQIQSLCIYTENETLPQTRNYKRIDETVREQHWYREFQQSGRGILIFAYVEDGNNYFSVIRRIDNFQRVPKRERVLKLDLRLTSFRAIIREENIQGKLYLVNGKGETVFASHNGYFNADERGFASFDRALIGRGETAIEAPFEDIMLLKGYLLVGVLDARIMEEALRSGVSILSVMSIVNLLFATLMILVFGSSLTGRLKLLASQIEKMGEQRFSPIVCREGKDEIGSLILQYNIMQRKISELITDVYEADLQKKNLEIERKQAELNALHSQLNPHFLFNTLSTIQMQSMIKGEAETAHIALYLSNILRRLVNWDQEMVTVQAELSFIEEYLRIQRYRFGDKIDYRIEAEDEALGCMIPMMCLQVFVENACVHGIEAAIGRRHVRLNVSLEEGYLVGCIVDNGVGMDEATLSKLLEGLRSPAQGEGRVGIHNVYRRLQLLYGDRFRLDIRSGPQGGCEVVVKIPLEEAQSV